MPEEDRIIKLTKSLTEQSRQDFLEKVSREKSKRDVSINLSTSLMLDEPELGEAAEEIIKEGWDRAEADGKVFLEDVEHLDTFGDLHGKQSRRKNLAGAVKKLVGGERRRKYKKFNLKVVSEHGEKIDFFIDQDRWRVVYKGITGTRKDTARLEQYYPYSMILTDFYKKFPDEIVHVESSGNVEKQESKNFNDHIIDFSISGDATITLKVERVANSPIPESAPSAAEELLPHFEPSKHNFTIKTEHGEKIKFNIRERLKDVLSGITGDTVQLVTNDKYYIYLSDFYEKFPDAKVHAESSTRMVEILKQPDNDPEYAPMILISLFGPGSISLKIEAAAPTPPAEEPPKIPYSSNAEEFFKKHSIGTDIHPGGQYSGEVKPLQEIEYDLRSLMTDVGKVLQSSDIQSIDESKRNLQDLLSRVEEKIHTSGG